MCLMLLHYWFHKRELIFFLYFKVAADYVSLNSQSHKFNGSRRCNYFTSQEDSNCVFFKFIQEKLHNRKRIRQLFNSNQEASLPTNRPCTPCFPLHHLSILCHYFRGRRCLFGVDRITKGTVSSSTCKRLHS